MTSPLSFLIVISVVFQSKHVTVSLSRGEHLHDLYELYLLNPLKSFIWLCHPFLQCTRFCLVIVTCLVFMPCRKQEKQSCRDIHIFVCATIFYCGSFFEQVWLCFWYTAAFTDSNRLTHTSTAVYEILHFTCSCPCCILVQANATLQEFANLRKYSEDWIESSNYIINSAQILSQTLPMLQVWKTQSCLLYVWLF